VTGRGGPCSTCVEALAIATLMSATLEKA